MALPDQGNRKSAFSSFTNGWRQRNANRLKNLAAGSGTCSTDNKTATMIFDGNILQGFGIPFDILPFEAQAITGAMLIDDKDLMIVISSQRRWISSGGDQLSNYLDILRRAGVPLAMH